MLTVTDAADVTVYMQATPHTANLSPAQFVFAVTQQALRYGLSVNTVVKVQRRRLEAYNDFRYPATDRHRPAPMSRMNVTLGQWLHGMAVSSWCAQLHADGRRVPFYAGANFAVHSSLRLPKAFLQSALVALQGHCNPELGHYIERLWFWLFYHARNVEQAHTWKELGTLFADQRRDGVPARILEGCAVRGQTCWCRPLFSMRKSL